MKVTTITELCQEIARREGGKSEVKFGDIREIFRHLADYMAEHDKTPLDIIAAYAAKRANKRRKK